MKKKVSVIVPVYNADKYLSNCIDSILEQTYQNIEVIIIDDGSSDNSSSICDEYKKIDNRIDVYHNQNSGVSVTRNFGLNKATGEYVVFIDSDDICADTMIEKMVEAIEKEKDIDMAICGIGKFNIFPNITERLVHNSGLISIEEYLEKILLKESIGQYCGGPYNKIFKREMLIKNKILFDSGVSYAEDFMFNIKVLHFVKKLSICNEILYYYRENVPESLTFKNYHNYVIEDLWKQKIYAYQLYEDIFDYYGVLKVHYDKVYSLLKEFVISTIKLSCKMQNKTKSETINFIRKICEDEYVNKRVCNGINMHALDKIRIRLIKNRSAAVLYYLEKTRYVAGHVIGKV